MYIVKRFINRLKRVVYFTPIIWGGYDFDYRYSLELFKHSLKHQADFMDSHKACALSAKTNAGKIRTFIALLDKVYNGEYAMGYIEELNKRFGPSQLQFSSFDSDEKVFEVKQVYLNEVPDNIEDIEGELMRASYDKQERAHKLLWKFLEHNIRHWWD